MAMHFGIFTKKCIIYVLTLLSSLYCKYFKSSFCNGVMCILVIENCIDGIKHGRSKFDLLCIENSIYDINLIGWSGIPTEQTEFRLVMMNFHNKINTI